MSNVYSTEPRTSGRVTLQTTHGSLQIELWSKECPLACRNFIQLCLEGYYDGSPFHRIVPGFCVQGGLSAHKFAGLLPLEAEQGAAAIGNGRFAIETHSRLRFSRRGLLAMAAVDQDSPKHANTSQFFFTLAEAPELNGKATLFGCLVGDSIYNLLRIGEVEVDGETPVWAPKILSTQVESNPFDDIIPRQRTLKTVEKQVEIQKTTLKKDKKLLSFEDEEDDSSPVGIKSSHDLLNDPKLSKVEATKASSSTTSNANVSTNLKASSNAPSSTSAAASSAVSFLEQMKAAQLKETQKKIAQVEAELRGQLQTKPTAASSKPVKPLSALEKHRQKWMESGKAQAAKRKPDAADEMDTLLKLNSFRSKIHKADASVESSKVASDNTHVDICKLHGLINCLSCRDTFGVRQPDGPEDEKGWILHKLVFDRRELDTSIREDL